MRIENRPMGNAVGAINKKSGLESLRPLDVGGSGAVVKRKELVWTEAEGGTWRAGAPWEAAKKTEDFFGRR